MPTTTAYTSLESLLLFRSLAAYGIERNAFSRISDLLKSNALINTADSYDPGRLSPDSLEGFCVQLLRDELKAEAATAETKGGLSPSKKRKLQSPPQIDIKDAHIYKEKLPQLVDRLYSRYRDGMILAIQEDERRYAQLQREIDEIERGEWDERLSKDIRGQSRRSASAAVGQATHEKAPAESTVSVPEVSGPIEPIPAPVSTSLPAKAISAPPMEASHTSSKPEGLAINDVINAQSSASSSPKHHGKKTTADAGNGIQAQAPRTQKHSEDAERAHAPSPGQQPTPLESMKWEQPIQGGPPMPYPPQYPPPANYPQFANPPYQQYPPGPPRGSFPGPHGLPHPIPLPSSPLNPVNPHGILLPPPDSNKRAAGSPVGASNTLPDLAGYQYRPPLPPSPHMAQGPLGPSGPGYVVPYSPSPQYRPDGRSPPVPPQQWNQPYPPQYAPMPPGYSYPPQPLPAQRIFPSQSNIIQPEQRQYNSPYNPSQGSRPILSDQSASSVSTPRPRPRVSGALPHTPASYSRTPHSTGKATRWTPQATDGTPKVPKSPTVPTVEPLSPVPQLAELPRTDALKPIEKKKGQIANAGTTRTNAEKLQQPRAGSATSSTAARSRRSQSLLSHADELSLDSEAVSNHKVKQESSTPRLIDDTGDITADEGVSRRRRDQLRDLVSPRRVQKRKRQETPLREPSAPPTHVLWTRNFPRISASALERIGAHRNANTFALPIKERDAPGYKDIILRPQDLKSIRMAIAAGNKAGAALAATMDDSGQASIMLPITEDLVPPKGIVNNAQLEKELMRMFANAIMFNPDPDRGFGKSFEIERKSTEETGGMDNYDFDENGVVKDTRTMFADVEEIVGEMRSAERRRSEETGDPDRTPTTSAAAPATVPQSDDDEVDELAADLGEPTGSVAKRRRRA